MNCTQLLNFYSEEINSLDEKMQDLKQQQIHILRAAFPVVFTIECRGRWEQWVYSDRADADRFVTDRPTSKFSDNQIYSNVVVAVLSQDVDGETLLSSFTGQRLRLE